MGSWVRMFYAVVVKGNILQSASHPAYKSAVMQISFDLFERFFPSMGHVRLSELQYDCFVCCTVLWCLCCYPLVVVLTLSLSLFPPHSLCHCSIISCSKFQIYHHYLRKWKDKKAALLSFSIFSLHTEHENRTEFCIWSVRWLAPEDTNFRR